MTFFEWVATRVLVIGGLGLPQQMNKKLPNEI